MTRIKICGLSRAEDITAVNNALPDYIGFVFAPSRRQVDLKTALELKKKLDKRIISVGVFVNAAIGEITKAEQSGAIDMIQLHGSEDEEYTAKLKSVCKKPVIKAITPPFGDLSEYGGEEDFLLLDSGAGSGVKFDWNKIDSASFKKPLFLAGGINEDNIAEAIRTVNPFALDVSSAVETDGKKDSDKILRIVRRIREYEQG